MATEVVMPQMGYDMQEGTLLRWTKQEGERVGRGEVIAEIETDKAAVEMEAFASGVLRKVLVNEGDTVPVGQVIAIIAEPDEVLPDIVAPEIRPSASKADAPSAEAEAPAPAAPPSTEPTKASPIARRLADERGIDLHQLTGTGPGGRITKDDVEAYQPPADTVPATAPAPAAAAPIAPPAHPEPVEGRAGVQTASLSRMRQAIARSTTQSKQQLPHFYVSVDIDMTRAMESRQALNQELEPEGVRISVNDLIVKACAKALARYPVLNASFRGDRLQMNPAINIGIAIALEQGLIVPAIGDCGSKSLKEIAQASRNLVERAHGGHLRQDEYSGGTFSISNLGMYDVDSFIAIILPPQSAVLAVGTVRPQPVARDNQVVVAQVMRASLSVDHRVADGTQAAEFLSEIKRLLENPAVLLI